MESIIQKYKASGTLVRWHDFRSGMIDDLTGNGSVTFANTPSFNRDGLVLAGNGAEEGVLDANNIVVGTNDYSVVALVRIDNADSFWRIYGANGAVENLEPFYLQDTTGLLRSSLNNQAYSPATGTNVGDGKWHVVGISADRSGDMSCYVDGVLDGTVDISAQSAVSLTVTNPKVGYSVTANRDMPGVSGAVLFFNNQLLTATEQAQIASELRNQKWPTKPRDKTQATSLINPGATGLLGAWDMKPQGSTVVDLSSAGDDAAITGNLSCVKDIVGDTLDFKANNESLMAGNNIPDGSTVFSTAILFKARGKGEGTFGRFFEQGVSNYALYVNNSDTNLNCRYNGAGGATNWSIVNGYVQDEWCLGIMTSDGTTLRWYLNNNLVDSQTDSCTLSTQDFYIGSANSGSRSFDGQIAYLQNFSHALTEAERTKMWNDAAKLVQYKTDWGTKVSDANVTSGYLEDTGWQVNSGTWKVSTDTINGNKVKVIECVVAGVVYYDMEQNMTQSEAMFGTFDLWTKWTTGDLLYAGIGDRVGLNFQYQGYQIAINSTGRLYFRRANLGSSVVIHQTTDAFVPSAEYQHYRFTRKYRGVFSIYSASAGGLLTLTTDDGTYSNPTAADLTFTTGRYLNLNLTAGGKVAIADVKGDHSIVKYLGTI